MKLFFNLIMSFLILFTSCTVNNKDDKLSRLAKLSDYLVQDHNSFVIAHEKLRREYREFLKNDLIFNQDSSSWEYRQEHKNLRNDYKKMLDEHQSMLSNHKQLVKSLNAMEFSELSEKRISQLSDSLYTERMQAVENHKDFMVKYNAFEEAHIELLYARRLDDH